MPQVVGVVVQEGVAPHLVSEQRLCLFSCRRLASAAMGALFNMGVFIVKQLVYVLLAGDGRLAVINITPELTMAHHTSAASTPAASRAGEAEGAPLGLVELRPHGAGETDSAGGEATPRLQEASGITELGDNSHVESGGLQWMHRDADECRVPYAALQ